MYRNSPTGIAALYDIITQKLSAEISDEPDNFIIGTSEEELLEFYYSRNHFTPVEPDPDREVTIGIKKVKKIIPSNQREWGYQTGGDLPYEFEYVSVSLPIKPHPQWNDIRQFEPSSYSSGFFGEEPRWTAEAISFDVLFKGYGVNKEEDATNKEVKQSIEWLYNKLSNISSDLERCNRTLKESIRQFIRTRKKKIEEDNQRYSSLLKTIAIPIRQKEDEAVKRIQLDPKPIIKRVRPTPHQPEEYVLDQSKVLDIISILDNQGRQFEKTPATYQKMEEEELRNILLVNLNSVFEGKATGETFSIKGKTDIHLNIDKGNILAFECKYWAGQKVYAQTIDQLLGYLSWRMNYGVIILFSRQKNFSHVLSEAKTTIPNHPSYRKGFKTVTESHFLSHHVLPTDEQKQVEIHHLFYTIPA